MAYIRHVPAPPLNKYINQLYYLSGPMPYPDTTILPLPVIDLKINVGGALEVRDLKHNESFTLAESWIVGIWSERHTVVWPSDARLFGVTFKAAGAYPFLHLPLTELHNQVAPLDTIWTRFAGEIRERLYHALTIQAGFALLESLLLDRLCEAPHGLEIAQHAAAEIVRQHGALSIRALSDQLAISQNHLGTLVKRMVGLPPKELARLHRFDYALRMIDFTQPVDWLRIAQQAGYYDQAHFSKDFASFTGHSPTEYQRIRRRESLQTPARERILSNLPID